MYTPADPKGTTTTIIKPAAAALEFSAEETAVLTPFQKRVFHLLKQIPAGRVTTYGSMARALGTSPRAVGNALRNNVFAPRIPCHRCVASTGYVNGYDGEIIQRTSFTRTDAGGAPTGKASQSRAGKVKAGMQGQQRRKKETEPPSGTNIQMKLDLLKTEGVTFDSKGMLKNRYKVLFDGPWDVLPA
ncbi:hypothetical protein PWT90_04170 [Aphanocladium album]|nr:hypothetical protein PWT90_04170 [Aphanocladium album]